MGEGGRTTDDVAGGDITMDARLSGGDRPIADLGLIGNADLTGQNDAVAHGDAARNADLGGHRHPFTNFTTVGNMHHVVQLGAPFDPSFADCRTINRRVAANFDPVFQHGHARLLHFFPAGGGWHKAKPFGPDRGPAMNDAVGSNLGAFVNHTVGVEHGAIANHRLWIDHHIGVNAHAIP